DSAQTTINGPGPGVLAVDGNLQDRVFITASNVKVSITGMKIVRGRVAPISPTTDALGGAIYNAGTLTLTNVTIDGNSANGAAGVDEGQGGTSGQGGGIYSTGPLTLTNCNIANNTATGGVGHLGGNGGAGEGGGVYCTNTLNVSGTIFFQN